MAFQGPFFTPINASGSGDNTVVAAVAGQRIVVLHYLLLVAGAVNATWKDAGSAVSGPLPFGANGGDVSTGPPSWGTSAPVGVLQTSQGNALVLNLSAGVQASGHLVYCLSNAP